MSRARPWVDPRTGDTYWFNRTERATAAQLELLADYESVDLDDLLDEGLSQRQVLYRLHEANNLIPAHVLEIRRTRAKKAAQEPSCRICSALGLVCEGRITRHHFVPRWLMLELQHYQKYAARSRCTIPVCVGRHRDLHFRSETLDDKSIVPYLNDQERALAEEMLKCLQEERPKIFELISGGTEYSYEYKLIRDFTLGNFRKETKRVENIEPIGLVQGAALAEA